MDIVRLSMTLFLCLLMEFGLYVCLTTDRCPSDVELARFKEDSSHKMASLLEDFVFYRTKDRS